jgi:Bacterial protein of unknown function (DUF882)
MRKRSRDILNWTLGLSFGLGLAAGASPGLAWAKPQNAGAKAATATAARAPGATAARAAKPKTRAQAKKKDAGPCLAPAVQVVRSRGEELEPRQLALTHCDGSPNPGALDSLSVLARPRDVERPLPDEIRAYQKRPLARGPKSKRRDPLFVSAQVMRVHPGLLSRLQQVANKFPGRALEIVSGYRPDARVTSRHHHARALDLRVAGVSNERVRDFLRGLEQTGVGYYPNSSFVHMDVREDKGYWVDRSGPGEPADYGVWPPPKQEVARAHGDLLDSALADLAALKDPLALTPGARPASGALDAKPSDSAPPKPLADPKVSAAPPVLMINGRPYSPPKPIIDPAPSRDTRSASKPEPREEGDQLSAAQIARIRKDALKALSALR